MKRACQFFERICLGLAIIFLLGSTWHLISGELGEKENGIPALYEMVVGVSFLVSHIRNRHKIGSTMYTILSFAIACIVLFDLVTGVVTLKDGGYSTSLIISNYYLPISAAIIYVVAFALNSAIHLRLGRDVGKAA